MIVTRNDAHDYFRDGKGPYPSVTTIVDAAVGKSQMLASVRRKAIEYTLAPDGGAHLTHGYDGDLAKLVDRLEAGATKAALAEADLGSRVHAAIEERIKWDIEDRPRNEARTDGVSVWRDRIQSDDISDHLVAFNAWEMAYKPRWVASERLIFNPEYGYGGTLDALALLSLDALDNELWLLDFKTGKRAWPEHVLQLAAYRAALIGEGVPVDRCAIVHIRPGLTPDKVWHPVDVSEADFEAFLACLSVYRWLNSRKEA